MGASEATRKKFPGGRRRADQISGGAHGMTPEQVERNQRERVTASMIELVARQGYPDLAVATLIDHAGISRRTFYDLYGDKQRCFLGVLEQSIEELIERVAEDVDDEVTSPHERAAQVAGGLIGFWLDEPATARICVVESITAGPGAIAQRAAMIERLGALIDGEGDDTGERGMGLAALALVGVVHELILNPPDRRTVDTVSSLVTELLAPSVVSASISASSEG